MTAGRAETNRFASLQVLVADVTEVRWENGLHPVSEPCGHEDGKFVLVHP